MMQKLLKPLILLALLICMFTACKKDFEDGPKFSLRSPESRLTGYWKFEKVTQDGVDITSNFNDSIKLGMFFDIYTKHNDWRTITRLVNLSSWQFIGFGNFVFYNQDQLFIKLYLNQKTKAVSNPKWYPFLDNYGVTCTITFLSNGKMKMNSLFENHEITIEFKKVFKLNFK